MVYAPPPFRPGAIALRIVLAALATVVLQSAHVGTPYAHAQPKAAGQTADEEQKPKVSCVDVSTETPYVAGYNHVVVLHSRCKKTMQCTVSTNVNPQEQRVALAPKETARVLTFRGSPASAFTPSVDCR